MLTFTVRNFTTVYCDTGNHYIPTCGRGLHYVGCVCGDVFFLIGGGVKTPVQGMFSVVFCFSYSGATLVLPLLLARA